MADSKYYTAPDMSKVYDFGTGSWVSASKAKPLSISDQYTRSSLTDKGLEVTPMAGELDFSNYTPDITNPSSNTGLFGLGTTDQWGTATGLGGLAMKAIALPQQMEYYGAQTDLAKQQLASNQQAMADKKAFNAGWANASNSVMGSGLANRSFTGAAGYGTGAIGSTNPVLKNGY